MKKSQTIKKVWDFLQTKPLATRANFLGDALIGLHCGFYENPIAQTLASIDEDNARDIILTCQILNAHMIATNHYLGAHDLRIHSISIAEKAGGLL